MIISHQHRYVFLELPHTATKAIAHELITYYGGEKILWKHARPASFWRRATPDERRYFKFATSRHPIDLLTTLYARTMYVTSLPGPEAAFHRVPVRSYKWARHGDSFDQFVRFITRFPPYYDDWVRIYGRWFDFVMRYDRLQSEFSTVLAHLGIEQVRPLPVRGKTVGKLESWQEYLSPDILPDLIRYCGPYMLACDYEWPLEMGEIRVPLVHRIGFHAFSVLRYLKWHTDHRLRVRGQPGANA